MSSLMTRSTMIKRISEKIIDSVLIVATFEVLNHAYCLIYSKFRKDA